jgi:hypothetical protein
MEVNMVEISKKTSMEVDNECQQEEYNKIAFPKEDETLTDFPRRFQKKQSEVMLFPQCSVVFDKKAAQNLNGVRRVKHQGFQKALQDQQVVQPIMAFDPRRYYDPRRPMMKLGETKRRGPTAKPISFKPNAKASNGKWVKPVDGRKYGQGKWKNFQVDRGSSLTYRKEFQADKKNLPYL